MSGSLWDRLLRPTLSSLFLVNVRRTLWLCTIKKKKKTRRRFFAEELLITELLNPVICEGSDAKHLCRQRRSSGNKQRSVCEEIKHTRTISHKNVLVMNEKNLSDLCFFSGEYLGYL